MNPTRSSKGSKASAGKYSDPWAREFQLDLNKVGTAHKIEEEIGNRQLHAEPDLKPEAKQNQAKQNQAKTEDVSSRLTNFYKVIKFIKQEPQKPVPKLKDETIRKISIEEIPKQLKAKIMLKVQELKILLQKKSS